jgi:DnaJ-class molecular chaperone
MKRRCRRCNGWGKQANGGYAGYPREAIPDCGRCHGTGEEPEPEDD